MGGEHVQPDRWYSTSQVGELLGGLHQETVRRLIHAGQLKAKAMVVRGQNKRPRMYVLASEVQRFMAESPDWEKKIERLEQRASRKQLSTEQATNYY